MFGLCILQTWRRVRIKQLVELQPDRLDPGAWANCIFVFFLKFALSLPSAKDCWQAWLSTSWKWCTMWWLGCHQGLLSLSSVWIPKASWDLAGLSGVGLWDVDQHYPSLGPGRELWPSAGTPSRGLQVTKGSPCWRLFGFLWAKLEEKCLGIKQCWIRVCPTHVNFSAFLATPGHTKGQVKCK